VKDEQGLWRAEKQESPPKISLFVRKVTGILLLPSSFCFLIMVMVVALSTLRILAACSCLPCELSTPDLQGTPAGLPAHRTLCPPKQESLRHPHLSVLLLLL